MACGDCLDFLDPLLSDESSSLGERLEPALQSKGHAFEQASMGHIREWMPIQNSAEIRHESQSARDLSQSAKEDSGAGHIRLGDAGFSGSPHRK